MAKVLQQSSLPISPAQQTSLTQACRVDDMHATQPADQDAVCNGAPLSSSPADHRAADACPLPVFDLAPMLSLTGSDLPDRVQSLCLAVADCLRDTGCLIVRDPRVKAEDNVVFLDMMERYFEQSTAVKLKDSRPQLHFQVQKQYTAALYAFKS